ncbi:heterokaryon incompatibility protein-domain-containing protein [Phaeosphaeriaceae sp. PMI808]|nr:heterokaryon incompatibility protein-domain-containing protein [Phaeosphaeriaceae sp. PMI808]
MRLLRANSDGSFSLTWFAGDRIPCYAILSHRWEEDNQEVTLEDVSNGVAGSKKGYRKIRFCGEQAKNDGLEFFWVDSCCIDKTSSAELSEAINSMFRWYRKATKCYVYLSDVTAVNCSQPQRQSAFRQSTWFTRGWTLQELLAPPSVEFFSHDNERLGDKVSLEQQIHKATGIAVPALQGIPLSQFSLDERLQWMVNRKTTIEEDFAYCLLGVLNIHMPLLYGEGAENACVRLLEEINRRSDIYIFYQGRPASYIIKAAKALFGSHSHQSVIPSASRPEQVPETPLVARASVAEFGRRSFAVFGTKNCLDRFHLIVRTDHLNLIDPPATPLNVSLRQLAQLACSEISPSPAPSWPPTPAPELSSTPAPAASQLSSQPQAKPQFKWTLAIETALLESLVKAVEERGLRADSGYKGEA